VNNRKASNALCTLVKREKKKFSSPGENCGKNFTDLTGSLVTSFRPPGRLQKRTTTEHRTLVSRYEQLTAASRLQMVRGNVSRKGVGSVPQSQPITMPATGYELQWMPT